MDGVDRTEVRLPKDDDASVIVCRDISKCYRTYERPVDRLLEGLDRIRGRGRTIDKPRCREFMALQSVSLEVAAGETVGIVGRNGSGKSTLLQIIAGTLAATTGSVSVRGRVAALLELGTGFNPAFTGLENVRLNASILGLSRTQMDARLDEMLEFADIGDFIHQPIRTYSSGMFVRLAFAVAISVDPDILIVDEALAVGDAAFQAKCMLRIRQLQQRGVALLFVSHDVGSVRALCRRVLYLERGRVVEFGGADTVIDRYIRDTHALQDAHTQAKPAQAPVTAEVAPSLRQRVEHFERNLRSPRHGTGAAYIRLVELLDHDGAPLEVAEFDQPVRIRIGIQANEACSLSVNYKIRDRHLIAVAGADFLITETELLSVEPGGWYVIEYESHLPLMSGDYSLRISLTIPIARHDQAVFVDVIEMTHPFKVLPAARGRIYTQVFLPHRVAVTQLAAEA